MTRNPNDVKGLNSGRTWTAVPAPGCPAAWTLDSNREFLKGPLALAEFCGHRISFFLEDGQFGFLAQDEELQAVYLDGGHNLEIGELPGQIHPDGRLYLLAADRPVILRWTNKRPLTLDNLPGPGIIGSCTLQISAPGRFFQAFLGQDASCNEACLAVAMDLVARETLEGILGVACSVGGADSATIQSTLTRLGHEDLSEELDEYGLACSQLAVYTAAPPVEYCSDTDSGQFSDLVHN